MNFVMKNGLLIGEKIESYLAHREPFLFVDRSEVSIEMTQARGFRTFRAAERFFEGHFPADPIVPGVILLEFAAQTANLLLSQRAGCMVQGYLVGVERASFNAPVRPGDTVVADVGFSRDARPESYAEPHCIVGFKASVSRDGQRCMHAALSLYRAS